MKKQINKPKCQLVIAGPGAGKTHNMVQRVLESIENLHPARYCVVITYTNAATDEIKTRLANQIKIPENVFIGTIHSFLNKFFIIPYASILDSAISPQKAFLQISSDEIVRNKMQKSGKNVNLVKKIIYSALNKQGGVVPK